jgi:cobalt-zinc-cadmium efflux system membrane fusion protein
MVVKSLASVGLLAVWAGCAADKKVTASSTPAAAPIEQAIVSTPERVTLPPNAPQLSKLRIEPAQSEDVETDEVSAPGSLETNANRVSHVTLPVAGRIASVAAKLGDSVHEGQTLVTVESPDLDAAELAYRQAETTVAQSKALENKALADADRLSDLFAHQAVAQKEVLSAQNALTLAKTSVTAAEAALQQTRRRLELLGLKPGNFGQKLSILAPLPGKVLSLSVVAGEYRNDLSAPLLTIADLRTLWVSANVPESSIRYVRVGGAVQIELVAFPGEVFRARVLHIADTVDAETRTVKVRAEIDNSSGRFRPEMYGRIKYGHVTEKLVVIPESGIIQYDGKPAAYVEEKPGYFVRRFLAIGKHQGDRMVVRDGIKPGERVVTSGAIYLKGGI